MKKNLFALIICVLIRTLTFCQSQADMTKQSAEDLKKAEYELDSLYKRVLRNYSDDSIFIKNFKLSQNFWLKYYNAEIKARYPDYPQNHFGSEVSMCTTDYALTLIAVRIKEVNEWLLGVDDNNDCEGSLKEEPSPM
jgi:hypothetical protein